MNKSVAPNKASPTSATTTVFSVRNALRRSKRRLTVSFLGRGTKGGSRREPLSPALSPSDGEREGRPLIGIGRGILPSARRRRGRRRSPRTKSLKRTSSYV